jgi:hypothetical protein
VAVQFVWRLWMVGGCWIWHAFGQTGGFRKESTMGEDARKEDWDLSSAANVAEQPASHFTDDQLCPACGQAHPPDEDRHASPLTTQTSEVTLDEPAFRCPHSDEDRRWRAFLRWAAACWRGGVRPRGMTKFSDQVSRSGICQIPAIGGVEHERSAKISSTSRTEHSVPAFRRRTLTPQAPFQSPRRLARPARRSLGG